MEHHTNKRELNGLVNGATTGSDRWLNLYNENIKCSCILHNSEIFAGIVNYVGTKMDLRLHGSAYCICRTTESIKNLINQVNTKNMSMQANQM